ncbi:MAG: hypothetical protein WCI00_01595 [bacterium]
MAILLLLGVQKHHQTERFLTALKQRVCGMKELHLTEDDITPYFIPSEGSIGEIVIFVEELPEKTEEIHNKLAERLAECAKTYCESPRLVKCIIRPFDQRFGYVCIVTKP